MPNYAASVLAEAQHIYTDRYSEPEKRLKTAGVLQSFLKNTQVAIPNIDALRVKEERPQNAYFNNRTKRGSIGSRTHNHSGVVGDSTEVALSWQTFGDVFQTSLKRSDNNVFSDAQILANEIDNAMKNIYEAIDAAALAYLDTNKSGVNVATKNGTFNGTNDVFEIAAADINRFLQKTKSMARQNYYNGSLDVILDSLLFVEAEFLASQGSGNATNFGYQFSGLDIMESVQLADANYTNGLGYAIPTGSIGVVDWIPSQNRAGYGDMDSFVGGFGTIVDPRSGMTFALHSYQNRADTSAAGGDTQDVIQEWEVTVDLSFNNAPLSVTDESTIFALGMGA